MNIIKIPNTETKGDILNRIAECIRNKDVFISKSIVNKLFMESHMQYEGDGTFCIIQLTWQDGNSKKMIKCNNHRDEYYMVNWIYINNEFKSYEGMFDIPADEKIFFEMEP